MRRVLPVLVLLAACGDPAGPDPDDPVVLAVNGAALPLLAPGDTIAIEGRGFGDQPGDGGVALGDEALTIIEWNPNTIVAVLSSTASGALTVRTSQGVALGPLAIRAAPVDSTSPDARAWSTGTVLPWPLTDVAAAGVPFATNGDYSGLVILFGGRRADGTVSDSTLLGRTDASGAITSWVSAPDTVVPQPRRLHAMVGASNLTSRVRDAGVAWMIGGIDAAGQPIADVVGISVGPDASYGLWTPLTPLPGDRAGAAAAVGLGAIYVAGGFRADSLARREVVLATIEPTGTITGWFAGPDLPEGLAFPAAAVVGSRLYVAGGVAGLVNPDSLDPANLRAQIYSIALSRRTGFFVDSAWTVEPVTLVHPRARHAMYPAGGGLVVVGGITADSAAVDTEWAPVAAGSLSAFRDRVGTQRADGPASGFAAPVLRNASGQVLVTVVGGVDSTGVSPRVWWH